MSVIRARDLDEALQLAVEVLELRRFVVVEIERVDTAFVVRATTNSLDKKGEFVGPDESDEGRDQVLEQARIAAREDCAGDA